MADQWTPQSGANGGGWMSGGAREAWQWDWQSQTWSSWDENSRGQEWSSASVPDMGDGRTLRKGSAPGPTPPDDGGSGLTRPPATGQYTPGELRTLQSWPPAPGVFAPVKWPPPPPKAAPQSAVQKWLAPPTQVKAPPQPSGQQCSTAAPTQPSGQQCPTAPTQPTGQQWPNAAPTQPTGQHTGQPTGQKWPDASPPGIPSPMQYGVKYPAPVPDGGAPASGSGQQWPTGQVPQASVASSGQAWPPPVPPPADEPGTAQSQQKDQLFDQSIVICCCTFLLFTNEILYI